MGVPKFFRWLSERYPAISQLISENRIPEFDCLYLDMNGIIHNCTHKDSDSPSFRLTEDKMFIAIFNYIEHLFGKIKPKKLFYMAIDGVAPRAKMNQQRARRFRTALDAEKAREKAIREGVELPKEDPFDSNCITPGTQFMARLTEQLKYFISKKVTEDVEWQGVEVVLSGHEVPGEGEHKIMEYIRQAKAQPGYDANIRHCLYGLDADLIMLGLLSHDPHFCLLREEVTFGRQVKKTKELEHQNFFLLHLCIVREYLELEFAELQREGALDFQYDMERIIDDFILMAFFVGNDFLPNLPNLHINEGALALMFQKYKEVLPRIGGYINEHGVINLQRLAVLLKELSDVEHRFFEAEYSDAKWIKSRRGDAEDSSEVRPGKVPTSISTVQKDLLKQIKAYFINPNNRENATANPLKLSHSLPARDRKFVQQLATDLNLKWSTQEDLSGNRFLQLEFPAREEDSDDEDDEEESQLAITRVIKRYQNARVEDVTSQEAQSAMQKKYDDNFQAWKDKYYQEKFDWDTSNETELTKLTENYVQGLQWVLFYYYRGVASWPWYYQYHYSPMISDVTKGLNVDMNFELGQPFRPFQQLMGVLPDRSKKIVPVIYHELMTSPDSPIIDFYPRDFELDMNGKKMEWEAVVKIPFIDEKRLLSAMATKDPLLSEDENRRNDFGVSLKFTYSDREPYTYLSPLPGIFPDIANCTCVHNIFDLPTMDGLEHYIGLVDGVKLGASALAGFPSLKTLPFTGSLGFHGVNVFQQDSRNESMVVTLSHTEARTKVEYAKSLLNKRVHINYPFLQEAKIVKVSDELFDYVVPDEASGQVQQIEHVGKDIDDFHKKAERLEKWYSKRLGMLTGDVESIVHVEMLKGLRKLDDGSTVKEFAFMPGMETVYATQMVVEQVISEDERFIERDAQPIEEEFPDGTNAFFLGEFAYGRPANVTGHENGKAVCIVATSKTPQVEFGRDIARQAERLSPYFPSWSVAKQLNMHPLALSKITSAFSLTHGGKRINLGLNLKFESKKQKVLGYSRKSASGWEFSNAAIELLAQYCQKFPLFIGMISKNPHGDMLPPTAYLPGFSEEQADEEVKKIQAWLKEIETKNFEKVPLDADQLDSSVVHQIELAADQSVTTEPHPVNKTMRGIPRNALLKPIDAQIRLGQQFFEVGDRVIYVADSGKVPIASKGTVVGLTHTSQETWLDVVFDVSFMSGTPLGDRCSPFRGSTVPRWSVLNLTNKQVLASSKASATRSGGQQTTLPVNGSNQAQFHEVPAPPALRGGWRGAVTGQNGGGRGNFRGRGGVNGQLPIRQTNGNGQARGSYQGGYQQIDRGDDNSGVLQNNPNFRPKSHHNVPPPTILDQPSRGRGRGRGQRGGDRGRGRGRGNAQIATNGTE